MIIFVAYITLWGYLGSVITWTEYTIFFLPYTELQLLLFIGVGVGASRGGCSPLTFCIGELSPPKFGDLNHTIKKKIGEMNRYCREVCNMYNYYKDDQRLQYFLLIGTIILFSIN